MADVTPDQIRAGLTQLDPANDEHWTEDGLPVIGVMNKLVKGQLRRGEITEAAPGFNRDNPTLEMALATEATVTTDQGADSDPNPDASADAGNDDDGSSQDGGADADDGREDGVGDGPLPEEDEGLGDLEDAVLEADDELAAAQAVLDEAKRKHAAAQDARDRAVEARDSRPDPHADQKARMAFIQAQADQRAARVGARLQVLGGLKLEDVDPRSPLDRAFARKTGFGHRKPPGRDKE